MDQLPPPLKAYVWATSIAMACYVLLLLEWAAQAWLHSSPFPDVLIGGLTIVTAIAIAIQLWCLLRGVQQSDEFMRSLMAKRLLTAAVIVIGSLTIWGLCARLDWINDFPLPLIFILFFVVHAALIPFINANRP